jgi:hypothetical protein
VTDSGFVVEAVAWLLFAAAAAALASGRGTVAIGLGLPALTLTAAEWLSSSLPPAVVVVILLSALIAAGARRPAGGDGECRPAAPEAAELDGWDLDRWDLDRRDGVRWDGLGLRLTNLTRDFLGCVVPRPDRAPKIDIDDPGVAWVIDGLLGAGDLMVDADGSDEPGDLAAAILEAERRWIITRPSQGERSVGAGPLATPGRSPIAPHDVAARHRGTPRS